MSRSFGEENFQMDYYDLDDILKEEEVLFFTIFNFFFTFDSTFSLQSVTLFFFFQKVPATFLCDGHALGFLDPVKHDAQDDLKEGEEIELPLWMVRSLSNKQYISLGLPKVYRKEAQNALLADPTIVSLKSGPYYYEGKLQRKTKFHLFSLLSISFSCFSVHSAAMAVLSLFGDEIQDSALIPGPDCLLLKVYYERYRNILNKSQNWSTEDLSAFTRTLSASEKSLFASGFYSSKDFQSWKTQQNQQIQTSDVLKTRKRKQHPT